MEGYGKPIKDHQLITYHSRMSTTESCFIEAAGHACPRRTGSYSAYSMTYKKKEIGGRLETDEEVIARLNTHTCGYCGSQLRYQRANPQCNWGWEE